jgi:hypothetical protein
MKMSDLSMEIAFHVNLIVVKLLNSDFPFSIQKFLISIIFW